MVINQRIKTTLHRAKAARATVESLVTLTKANTIAAKRQAYEILGDHKLVSKLFNEIGPRFAKRQSGFTRIINLAKRRGDDAQIVIFELTEIKEKEIKKPKKAKETKLEEAPGAELAKESPPEKKSEAGAMFKEKPPISKKPTKKFLGGLRNIFKKERDSL